MAHLEIIVPNSQLSGQSHPILEENRGVLPLLCIEAVGLQGVGCYQTMSSMATKDNLHSRAIVPFFPWNPPTLMYQYLANFRRNSHNFCLHIAFQTEELQNNRITENWSLKLNSSSNNWLLSKTSPQLPGNVNVHLREVLNKYSDAKICILVKARCSICSRQVSLQSVKRQL